MEIKVAQTLKVASLAVLLGLGVGCASSQLQKDVNDAKAMAEAAKQAADQALQTVESAKSAADQAQQTADQALQSAGEANACCQETNEKIDRMFKKSMEK